MRIPVALFRLLHVSLVLALMLGVVLRPSLSQLADLHTDEHRAFAAHHAEHAGDLALPVTHLTHGADDAELDAPTEDDGHVLHALMHLGWTGGSVGYLTYVSTAVPPDLCGLQPWSPLAGAALAVRLPSPLRPPIA